MDKIFHGIMKAPTLGDLEKMRVVKMLEQSGRQSHQTQEVKSVMRATLFYWLNLQSSPLNIECSEKIFHAWSQNYIPVMVEVLTDDFPSIINKLASADVEDFDRADLAMTSNNRTQSISVYCVCKVLGTAIKIASNHSGTAGGLQCNNGASLDSLSDFIKNTMLYDLFKQSAGIRPLDALASLLMECPTIIPWETCSVLVNVVVSKLSTCMFALDEDPNTFIRQCIRVSKLIKYIWSKAVSPKMMILESLKTLFGIVSSTGKLDTVSVALSTVLQSVPETMISGICSNLVNDRQVSDEQLSYTLLHMVDWLKWPKHITIHHWIVQIASELAKNGRLTVLFEVTNTHAESISKKLWYINIQLTVLHVLTNLLLFHQRCPQAFHSSLPHLLKVFEDSGTQDLRCQISELIQIQMYIHPGYPELYEEPTRKITTDFPIVSETDIQSLVSKFTNSTTSSKASQSFVLSPTLSQEGRGERVGLVNLGNTCFLNSVVQALYNIGSVRSCLLSEEMNLHSKLLMQLQIVFAYLHQTSRSMVSPDNYVKASLPGWFVLGEQQDSSEYLRFILDGVHEALKAHDNQKDFTEMFSGHETILTKCLNCQTGSQSQQKFYDLSLHFPDESNTQQPVELVEMIESSLKPVQLRGDNQFHCDKCASLQDADRSIADVSLPSLLVITLCRFSYNPKLGKHTKLRTPVKYPPTLELGEKVYSLNGVVVHSGVSLNGGHYYTYAHTLTGDQQWYLFNDSRVTACSNPAKAVSKSNRLSSDTPYILFYTDTASVSSKDAEPTLSASLRHLIVRDNLKYEEEKRQQAHKTKTQSARSANLSWYSYTDDDDQQPPGSGSDNSVDLSGSRFIF